MTDHDLITWLRAQLDEDERRADACAQPFLYGDRTGMDGLHPMILNHVRSWTPARVRSEVEAKRRILDDCVIRRSVQAHRLLKLIALPYADRDGYHEEWRPG